MPTDKKKTRKLRGHVSSGYGRVGKHRKHPGGRGKAGGQHHHRIMFDKKNPKYFGKIGMRILKTRKKPELSQFLNLGKLESQFLGRNSSSVQNILNIKNTGNLRLMGKGRIENGPRIIKASYFSSKSEKKILKSGGTCILIS